MQALSDSCSGKMVHDQMDVRSTGGALEKLKEFKIKEGSEIHVIAE